MGQRASSFDVQAFFESTAVPTTVVEHRAAEILFAQGDRDDRVMYLLRGRVTLSVRSRTGREAAVVTLSPGDFFGEGCMAGQTFRLGSATAMTATRVLVIKKKLMAAVFRKQRTFSNYFIAQMLSRNVRIEQQLIDRLFDATEKRLARTLLLLARYGHPEPSSTVVPNVPPSSLSKVLGTTPSHVDHFMKKFKALGFVQHTDDVNGVMQIDRALLSIALRD